MTSETIDIIENSHITIKLHTKFNFSIVKESLERIVKKYGHSRVRFFIFWDKRPLKCSAYLKTITRDYSSGKCTFKLHFKHFKSGKMYKLHAFIPFKSIRFIKNSNLIFQEILEDNVLSEYFQNHFESKYRLKNHQDKSKLTKFSFL